MFEFLKSIFLILSVITGLFLVFVIVYVFARLIALAFLKTIEEKLKLGKGEKNEDEEKTIH